MEISEKMTNKSIIPKLNSALFTADNYSSDNSILLYKDKLIKYALGWCYTDELNIRFNTTFNREVTIMYEVPEDETGIETGKYWNHLPLTSFIFYFIPAYFE